MIRTLLFIVWLALSFDLYAITNPVLTPYSETTSGEVVIIEITDHTMNSVFYEKNHFNVPTKIVFTNLTRVEGIVYFNHTNNLVGVEFPLLETIDGYLYMVGNESLESFHAPKISTVKDYIYITQNHQLTHLEICSLKAIIQGDETYQSSYYIIDNTDIVDSAQPCWGSLPPSDLMLSNVSISENLAAGSVIGTLSATKAHPDDSVTFFLTGAGENDTTIFIITGNVLKIAQPLNYEILHEYQLEIGAKNQYGEKVTRVFSISVTDIVNEDVEVIEITDNELDRVYYEMISYENPTKIIFTNLTTVKGCIHFHKNSNLVGVEFPVLTRAEGYFFFIGNLSLESISAPAISTISNYIAISGNTSLTHLDICNLSEIVPSDEYPADPYYSITNNTQLVDSSQPCWGSRPPENLELSNLTILENEASGTVIGTLAATAANPEDQLRFSFTDENAYNNEKFSIKGNELTSNISFDYEALKEYVVEIGVRNQFGDRIIKLFTIEVLDVEPEKTDTVVIPDLKLNTVLYQKTSYKNPTILIFENLTNVDGPLYFNDNSNVVSVEFPVLESAKGYLFCLANKSLLYFSAPALTSVSDFVYVEGNTNLKELEICSLSEILPQEHSETYYYITNNPSLDFETTCLLQTQLYFDNQDSIHTDTTEMIFLGSFRTNLNEEYSISYFIADSLGNTASNNDFMISDNSLYLKDNYNSYMGKVITIPIGAIRYSNNESARKSRYGAHLIQGNGLNEKIVQLFDVAIPTLTPVREYNNPGNILIYPNPSSDRITLSGIDFSQDLETEIIDCFGKTIAREKNPCNELNISLLTPGVYFLKISTPKDSRIAKIVKK